MEEKVKSLLPGWKIVRMIGRGSFGAVYEVEKEDDFGTVAHSALKVLSIPETGAEIKAYRDDGYDDMSLTALFRSQVEDITSEFALMSKLKGNSNIVSYEDHAIVQHESDPGYDIYIRMELLTPLPDYINQHYPGNNLSDQCVAQLGIDICNALELCAKHHIIHRDIKPQNIFVNDNGDFKLGDFGIAKTSDHTTKATKTGTYGYMAPEVYLSRPYNATVDIYSLGMVMYWMLNERRGPFVPLPPAIPKPSQNSEALELRMHGEPLPAPKNGSDELKQIILKACAFNPKERYATPTELKHALEAFLSGSSFASVIPIVPVVPVSEPDFEATVHPSMLHDEASAAAAIVEQPTDNQFANEASATDASDVEPIINKTVKHQFESADASGTVKVSSDSHDENRTISIDNSEKKSAKKASHAKEEAKVVSIDSTVAKKADSGTEPSKKTKPTLLRYILLGLSLLLVIIVVLILIFWRNCSCKNKQAAVTVVDTTASPVSTSTPKVTSAPEITAIPTEEPTLEPVSAPEETPLPTDTPTPEPTSTPAPTKKPTAKPTAKPTNKPTAKPTATPEPTWSGWSTNLPPAGAIATETKTQYRYRDKSTTTSSSSSLSGWTLQSGPDTVYGDWSSWSNDSISASSTLQVEKRRVYRLYYYACSKCGYHMPWYDEGNGGHPCYSCGKHSTPKSSHKTLWQTTPYSSLGSSSSPGGKRKVTIGGNLWYFNSADMDGTPSSSSYIKDQWRSRSISYVYTFYQWSSWSAWSDTAVSSSATRQVETQTLYRYKK
ncbi:MAG: protein kinase [Clostridia bacterium]|nr:protein kinase [Clostridia bacterium]